MMKTAPRCANNPAQNSPRSVATFVATIARRGILEVDDQRDHFDLETDRFDLSTWARTELQNWISDDELRPGAFVSGPSQFGLADDVEAGSLVSEEYLMALERKHFCSLLDNPKTQERIMGMLQTGKPVRN